MWANIVRVFSVNCTSFEPHRTTLGAGVIAWPSPVLAGLACAEMGRISPRGAGTVLVISLVGDSPAGRAEAGICRAEAPGEIPMPMYHSEPASARAPGVHERVSRMPCALRSPFLRGELGRGSGRPPAASSARQARVGRPTWAGADAQCCSSTAPHRLAPVQPTGYSDSSCDPGGWGLGFLLVPGAWSHG